MKTGGVSARGPRPGSPLPHVYPPCAVRLARLVRLAPRRKAQPLAQPGGEVTLGEFSFRKRDHGYVLLLVGSDEISTIQPQESAVGDMHRSPVPVHERMIARETAGKRRSEIRRRITAGALLSRPRQRGLLGAIAYGWRREALAQNAQEVADLGRQLYERIAVLAGHWGDVGKRLDQAVGAYNSSVATLESRVLVSARRLRDLKAAPEEATLDSVEPVERTARALQAPGLVSLSGEER